MPTFSSIRTQFLVAAVFLYCLSCSTPNAESAGPLPSWNEGAAKTALLEFVTKVTNSGSPDFVPVAQRIAVFDNDGTLWSEQPMYFQAFFIFDRIKQLAPQHPEWKSTEPFASVLKGDVKSALAGGEHALIELAMATHAGMTTEKGNLSVSSSISVGAPSWRSAILTATSRCSSGPPAAAVHDSDSTCITPMPSVNGRMTVSQVSASSTEDSMKQRPEDGQSST